MPGKEAGAARIRGRKRSYSLEDTAVIPAKETVAKDPEKKGTTKTRRYKVFSSLPKLRPADKKGFLGVFVVQRFYAFCDNLMDDEYKRQIKSISGGHIIEKLFHTIKK